MSTAANSDSGSPLELDAVVVGAGFSGIYVLQRLRDELKMNVKILEAGSRLGGTWNWNTYPGTRVDIAVPHYSFGFEEVGKTWNWSELYPSQEELQAYFQYVDKLMSIRKDCIFDSYVKSASFDQQKAHWIIQTENGLTVVAKYFIPATGSLSKSYIPSWKGLESFQGPIWHSSSWPSEGVDVHGKRVAVIGTGASGIQISQEWAKEASEMFVFQRSPNYCLPMRQEKLDLAKQEQFKKETAAVFSKFRATGISLPWDPPTAKFADKTPEEWEKVLDAQYTLGGMRLWLGAYMCWATDLDANRYLYDFWAKKTRERIHDPVKRDLLAPLEPPYPFGTKRVPLEQDYYEQLDKPHVHLVNTSTDPIAEITPRGIVTESGCLIEVDAIALATGFDAAIGALSKMNIQDTNGVHLGERWKNGVLSFFGIMVPGFPNMFIPYGPQSPATISTAPMMIEFHADWIRDAIRKFEKAGVRWIEPRPEIAQDWREEVQSLCNMTLLPLTNSWYMGANVPGKAKECLYYMGGVDQYVQKCADCLDSDIGKSFLAFPQDEKFWKE